METAADRRRRKLGLLIDHVDGGLKEIAREADLNPASLDQVMKQTLLPPKQDGTRSPKSLGSAAAQAIEKAFRLGSGWFDSDAPLPAVIAAPVTGGAPRPVRPQDAIHDDDGSIIIRHYDTGGAMGGTGLILRDQPGVIQSWEVSREWVRKNVRSHTGLNNLRLVTGFGDSMRPIYDPGDPLLVDMGIKILEMDSVYFFRVGDEGFVKRLQRIPGVGIRVISANKEYETWTITQDMDFEILAHVLRAWKGDDY